MQSVNKSYGILDKCGIYVYYSFSILIDDV